MALLEELAAGGQAVLEVVLVDRRPHAQLLELGRLAVRAALLLALRVLELAEVHDAAHGRPRGGRDLDQVEAGFLGSLHGVERRDDPDLLALLVDEPDFGDADLSVDAVVDCCH